MAEALTSNSPASTDRPDVPIMTARDLLAYRWRQARAPRVDAPQAVIVCYQRKPLGHVIKRYRAKRVDGFFGEFHVVKIGQISIGIMRPIGPGAPIAAMVLEELIAFGVRRFVSIGLAGGLQPDLRAGDVAVCARALRDEGTSGHYLPATPSMDANSDLVQQLSAKLLHHGVAHQVGASWTTDAPFRETCGEVRQKRDAGVLTVEMESAAFLAVARYFNVDAAAVFVIGDNLADLVWRPADDMRLLNHSLNRVADCVAEVLSVESMSTS